MSLSRAERNLRTGLVGTIGTLRRPVIEPPSGEIARDPTEESDEHRRFPYMGLVVAVLAAYIGLAELCEVTYRRTVLPFSPLAKH
jgi:hypothetical protein